MTDNEYIDFDDNDPKLFYELPNEIQAKLLAWISTNLCRSTKVNLNHTLYKLKTSVGFDSDLQRYYYNGEFVGAMVCAGYNVRFLNNNTYFNVSELSPCLR